MTPREVDKSILWYCLQNKRNAPTEGKKTLTKHNPPAPPPPPLHTTIEIIYIELPRTDLPTIATGGGGSLDHGENWMDVEPQLNRKQIGVGGGGGNPLNTVNS